MKANMRGDNVVHGIVFKKDKCKCFSCLYLMTYYKDGKDKFGNDNIKVHCMLGRCIYEKKNSKKRSK